MIFPTIEFAAFFLVVFTLSWLLMPHQRVWKPFILAASFFFYGYADVRFVLLLAVSMLLNQAGALAVHRAGTQRLRKALMLTTVIGNLGLLGWFKYYGFFADSVDAALRSVGLGAPLPFLRIALPVGISFFTFMAMSYVIDVYRREIRPTSLINFAVFEAFFPHLVAGPIVRASEFLPQLEGPRNPRDIPAARAFFLIMGGLFKKVVLAELLATHIVDPVFNSPGAHSAAEMLVAIYAYAVQIFCDFSAYSEMAIGFALLLGFRFPDNFNRPYTATSLRDFWHRWHMTLSRWLRDYLYIPLGGNRRGPRRTYVNLMATMLLGGLWHGAAWTFVIWGGIHGTGLCVEHWWAERKSSWRRRRVAAPYLPPYPARGAGVAADPPPYPPPAGNVRVLADGGESGGSGPRPAPGRAAPRPHPAAAARLDKPGLYGQAPSRVGARPGPAPGAVAAAADTRAGRFGRAGRPAFAGGHLGMPNHHLQHRLPGFHVLPLARPVQRVLGAGGAVHRVGPALPAHHPDRAPGDRGRHRRPVPADQVLGPAPVAVQSHPARGAGACPRSRHRGVPRSCPAHGHCALHLLQVLGMPASQTAEGVGRGPATGWPSARGWVAS